MRSFGYLSQRKDWEMNPGGGGVRREQGGNHDMEIQLTISSIGGTAERTTKPSEKANLYGVALQCLLQRKSFAVNNSRVE